MNIRFVIPMVFLFVFVAGNLFNRGKMKLMVERMKIFDKKVSFYGK